MDSDYAGHIIVITHTIVIALKLDTSKNLASHYSAVNLIKLASLQTRPTELRFWNTSSKFSSVLILYSVLQSTR